MAITPRHRCGAAILAAALAAAGCSGGTAETGPAPGAQTADPPSASAQTAAPAPATTADPCRFTAGGAEWWTSQARELMDRAEAADGPPDETALREIADLRHSSRFDRGCPGVWDDEDDARFWALTDAAEAAAAGERAAAAEAAERLPAAAALENAPADPGPDSNPDRPGCQTQANPVACWPPGAGPELAADPGPGPEPEPEPEPGPEPEPEPPATTAPAVQEDFEDAAEEVPQNPAAARRHDGPVTLGAGVPFRSLTEYVCPPEEDWRAAGYDGCGEAVPGDYLYPHKMFREDCVSPPVELGVGDVIASAFTGTFGEPLDDGTVSYRSERTLEILGFSPPASLGYPWAAVQPRVRETETFHYEMADGSTEVENRPVLEYRPGAKWWHLGGGEARGYNPDGSLAWALIAVPAGCP